MSVTHVVGVDPGLVHTGVVSLVFAPEDRCIFVGHEVVTGPDARAVADAITQPWPQDSRTWGCLPPVIFIEGYRPRSHLQQDKQMTQAVTDMKRALPGSVVLQNTGVKKVIRQPLMELVGCWRFTTPTHHQDLRSAARIALLGMCKDEEMNRLLATVVADHLDGRTWNVAAH